MGKISTTPHILDLFSPLRGHINSVPYQAGPQKPNFGRLNIENVLEITVKWPAKAKVSSPVVFLLRKDWNLRLFTYYRKLNDGSVLVLNTITRMEGFMNFLAEAQLFSTLNANRGYWQIEGSFSERKKSSLLFQHALNQHTAMLFQLSNAPAIFQCIMYIILSPV